MKTRREHLGAGLNEMISKKEAYVAERLPQVRKALENVANGSAEFNTLTAEDGR